MYSKQMSDSSSVISHTSVSDFLVLGEYGFGNRYSLKPMYLCDYLLQKYEVSMNYRVALYIIMISFPLFFFFVNLESVGYAST